MGLRSGLIAPHHPRLRHGGCRRMGKETGSIFFFKCTNFHLICFDRWIFSTLWFFLDNQKIHVLLLQHTEAAGQNSGDSDFDATKIGGRN